MARCLSYKLYCSLNHLTVKINSSKSVITHRDFTVVIFESPQRQHHQVKFHFLLSLHEEIEVSNCGVATRSESIYSSCFVLLLESRRAISR